MEQRIDSYLETKQLSSGYGNKVIISGIELVVRPGEVVSMIGPNGAGKTTILKTITGANEALSGTVYICGKESKDMPMTEKSKIMSVMMTERNPAEQITCREVVSLGRYPFTGRLGVLREDDWEKVDKAMDFTGITELADRDYKAISDGQRQRVLLARAIAQEPKLLLLDEPTSYLDISHKLLFLESLKKLAQENQIGVLMSMHELELAYYISDRVVCISGQGEMKRVGKPDEVFDDAFLSGLYGLPEGKLGLLYSGFVGAVSAKK